MRKIPVSINKTPRDSKNIDDLNKQFKDYMTRWDEIYRFLVSDLDSLFAGVYGELYQEGDNTKTADSVQVTDGSIGSGSVADTRAIDQVYLHVDESGGTPGFIVQYTFVLDNDPGRIDFVGRYQGSTGHRVVAEAFNYDTSTWERFTASLTDFPSETEDYELFFDYDDLAGTPADYKDTDGTSLFRVDHTSPGNVNHDFYTDYIAMFERGITIATGGTFQTVTDYTEGGSNRVTLDGDLGTMTIVDGGSYAVFMSVSFSGSDSATFEGHIFVNDVKQNNIGAKRKLGTDGDVGSTGFSGRIQVVPGDVVKIKLTSDMTGDYASIENINWMIQRIGN
jgi:hypothetical protein